MDNSTNSTNTNIRNNNIHSTKEGRTKLIQTGKIAGIYDDLRGISREMTPEEQQEYINTGKITIRQTQQPTLPEEQLLYTPAPTEQKEAETAIGRIKDAFIKGYNTSSKNKVINYLEKQNNIVLGTLNALWQTNKEVAKFIDEKTTIRTNTGTTNGSITYCRQVDLIFPAGTPILNCSFTESFTTTKGNMTLNLISDIGQSPEGYAERNYTINLTKTDFISIEGQSINITIHNGQYEMYQSEVNITSTEIITSKSITTFSIKTPYKQYNTTNGLITIYSNKGYNQWNWTNNFGYFNITGLHFNITSTGHNKQVNNAFARNITFINNMSATQIIYPYCEQNGHNYTTPYLMPKSTSTTNCYADGFQTIDLTLQTMPDNNQYAMNPAMLWLTFTENISGRVLTSDCTAEENNCQTFNQSTVYIQQYNLSLGYISVEFNPSGTNWQQMFKYYNNNNTHIKEYIKVISPDLFQEIKVAGEGGVIENARVCAKELGTNPETNTTDWLTVYCDYTDSQGITSLGINDQETQQFCVQAEGYTSKCVLEYIPPSNTESIIINLEATTTIAGHNYISTNCPTLINGTQTCSLEIYTYQTYNTICINQTNLTGTQQTCYSSSTGTTHTYTTNENTTISIYLENTLTKTINHILKNYNPSKEINFKTTQTGTTLIQKLEGNINYYILAHILVIIAGIVMGFMAEKYFNNYGIYGSGLWFGIIGFGGLYIFLVPALIIGIHFTYKVLIPLFKIQ